MADKKKKSDTSKLGLLVRVKQETDVAASQFSKVGNLTDQQEQAKAKVLDWFRRSYERTVDEVTGKVRKLRSKAQQLYVMAGYAGTGKTTTLGFIAQELCRNHNVACCAFTGKAASVFGRSLRAAGVDPGYVGTIHRMMYRPKLTDGLVTGWHRAEELDYDLIIVDEASMLSQDLLEDLLRFRIPILAVGDHGQLPPVGEDVSLMSAPDVRLEEVHRQALDNPVIAFSMLVRQGGNWRAALRESTDPRLQTIDLLDIPSMVAARFRGFQERPMSADPMVLCGTNKIRRMLNQVARRDARDSPLVVGDRVLCLKNEYLNGALLANGFRGRITETLDLKNHIRANVAFPDEQLELQWGLLNKDQLGAEKTFKSPKDIGHSFDTWEQAGLLFDYGYALTVHKAQGSQAEEVLVYVENFAPSEEDFRRWLYTAATRSSQALIVAF